MALNPRVIVGPRANGDIGLFVSPPGVNADTAADAALRLSITSKVSQLIMLGQVASNQTISLGLSRSPFVFVTSCNTLVGVPGHTWGDGPVRPSPLQGGASAVVINSNGASMTIVCSTKTIYEVYNQAFT